jgi:hypothetical protein
MDSDAVGCRGRNFWPGTGSWAVVHPCSLCALFKTTSSRAIQAMVDPIFLVSDPARHPGVLASSPRHACALPQHSGAATLRCFRKPAASGDHMRVHLCLPAVTANFELILPSFNILFMHIWLRQAYYVCILFRNDGKPMDQLRLSVSREDMV